MSGATISAVIPAYNSAGTLARAVASALAQTCPPAEVIVVDDGSTDDTASVGASFGEPIRLIRRENGGPGAARNTGIRAARGQWIGLLDADDAWLPHRLESQAPHCADERVGLIFSGRTGRPLGADQPVPDVPSLWSRNPILNSSVLLRKAAWEAVGRFDEDRELIGVEDYNLWLRLASGGWTLQPVPGAVVDYTPAPGCLTRQVSRFHRAELANARKIARELSLPVAMLRAKEAALGAEYGRELFNLRDFRAARPLLGLAARRGTIAALPFYLASFLPAAVVVWAASVRRQGTLSRAPVGSHGS